MTSYSPIEIYLNSKYADLYINGSSDKSDMLFYFSEPIIRPSGYALRVRVSSFVMPISFTLVNEDNDTLVIDSTTYNLEHGNYNALTLRDHLRELLPSFTINFDTITNKYTFSKGSAFTFTSASTCFLLLGFTEDINHGSVANTLTSDSVVNLSGAVNELYISIENISTFNLSSTNGQRTSIIKSIPVQASPGTVLFWENRIASYVQVQNDVLSFFHIRLLGEDLRTPIRMNGQDWNMTLEISFAPLQDQNELTRKNFSQAYDQYLSNLALNNGTSQKSPS